ncbi:vanadium-dependent haloperoxidase [Agarilytica rhodophyticola]|uniref:vanadium-dependent haloperoxidase n=1 Tax=Agarilytica rhodophyticola TaxID=1737490 RepID=UPI000B347E47|nr:vanadium-dependent haloperoxidase [Agarilytica rhodophyticola]
MKKRFKKLTNNMFAILFALSTTSLYVNAVEFDFDNGDASTDVVVPNVGPAVYESVSVSTANSTVVPRITTFVTNAWFDATAPYHDTAVGIYSSLGRRPADEAETHRNMNIAMIHASYHVLMALIPDQEPRWRKMLQDVGLDPDNESEDTTTPEGIGNVAGKSIILARLNDGMNQLGNAKGQKYNQVPYSDYTGYRPRNTAYRLRDPSRWQPQLKQSSTGSFAIQQFVTPQLQKVTPLSFESPKIFRAPYPIESQVWNYPAYKNQAKVVLENSASLNDERKMKAELFNDRFRSLGFSAIHITRQQNQTLLDWIHYDFMLNVASFDTAIAIWQEKRRYDSVRPFSAINYIFGNRHVTAWGGAGEGTVNDLPANQWKSYIDVPDHPSYPSATAALCSAHAEISRTFFDSDTLTWTVPHPKGSSNIEPGITPAMDMFSTFDTWTDWETDCGQSRIWAGVQFPAAIPAGQDIGREVAQYAFDFVLQHMLGKPEK